MPSKFHRSFGSISRATISRSRPSIQIGFYQIGVRFSRGSVPRLARARWATEKKRQKRERDKKNGRVRKDSRKRAAWMMKRIKQRRRFTCDAALKHGSVEQVSWKRVSNETFVLRIFKRTELHPRHGESMVTEIRKRRRIRRHCSCS